MRDRAIILSQRSSARASAAVLHSAAIQRQCACGRHSQGEECESCKTGNSPLQRRGAEGEKGGGVAPPIVAQVLDEPGTSLEGGVRASMQNRIGHDFSRVRVHTGERAAASAAAVDALAYTAGNHIVFGHGRWAPGTPTGDRLLAHELAHTVQQESGDVTAGGEGLRLGDPGDRFERDAEAVSEAAVPASKVRSIASAPMRLQRQAATAPAPATQPAGTRPEDFGITLAVVDHGASGAAGAARERLNEIYLHLDPQNLAQLQSQGITAVEMHIIPRDQKLTDIPEFTFLRGVRTPDGRRWETVRGMGGRRVGNKILYGVAEEELLGGRSHAGAIGLGILGGVLGGLAGVGLGMLLGGLGPESGRGDREAGGAIAGGIALGAAGIAGGIAAGSAIDARTGYGENFVASHETGHTVQLFALTPAQQTELQRLFNARKAAGGPWLEPEGYTSSNLHEYFAQCTSAFFRRPYQEAYRDTYNPEWLQANDPGMYRFLRTIYSTNMTTARVEPERAERAAA